MPGLPSEGPVRKRLALAGLADTDAIGPPYSPYALTRDPERSGPACCLIMNSISRDMSPLEPERSRSLESAVDARLTRALRLREAMHGIAKGPPRKPSEGAPCNGCGLCCALQLCPIAIEFIEAAEAPCPAMEYAGGRFWCGLARYPSRYFGTPASSDRLIRPMVQAELSIGEGCDASD